MYVSNSQFPGFDPDNQVLLYEYFAGAAAPIHALRWWGIGATFDDQGVLAACPLAPGEFEISFWAHDADFDRPDYAAGPLYSFTASAASGLVRSDTGHVYQVLDPGGEVVRGVPAVGLGLRTAAAAVSLFKGWISIQNTDLCAFWWAAVVPGDQIPRATAAVRELRSDAWMSAVIFHTACGPTRPGHLRAPVATRRSALCRHTTAGRTVSRR